MPYQIVTTVGSSGPGAAPLLFPAPAGTQYTYYTPAETGYGPPFITGAFNTALPPGAPTIFGQGPTGGAAGAGAAGGGAPQFVDWSGADDDLGENFLPGNTVQQLPQATGLFWLGAIAALYFLTRK